MEKGIQFKLFTLFQKFVKWSSLLCDYKAPQPFLFLIKINIKWGWCYFDTSLRLGLVTQGLDRALLEYKKEEKFFYGP